MARRTIGAAFLLGICTCGAWLCGPAVASRLAGTGITLLNPDARRLIPLRLYDPGSQRPLVVLLPGVGARPGDYSFLARYLVRRGFAVAELQLELPGDPPIATRGNIAALRGPELHSNLDSLRYAIRQLEHLRYASARRPAVLVGHSNGGDVAMLYGSRYPGRIAMILSLDNLRVPIPRAGEPHICSLRSSDQQADEGVVPDKDERRRFDIQIEPTKIPHDQMWNGATVAQQRLMLNALGECLKHRRR